MFHTHKPIQNHPYIPIRYTSCYIYRQHNPVRDPGNLLLTKSLSSSHVNVISYLYLFDPLYIRTQPKTALDRLKMRFWFGSVYIATQCYLKINGILPKNSLIRAISTYNIRNIPVRSKQKPRKTALKVRFDSVLYIYGRNLKLKIAASSKNQLKITDNLPKNQLYIANTIYASKNNLYIHAYMNTLYI